MALAVRNDVVQPLLCVVSQLLWIGDLWAHVGINVQEVDAGLVPHPITQGNTPSQDSHINVASRKT